MSKSSVTALEIAQRLDDMAHLALYRELVVKVQGHDIEAALAVVESTSWPSRIPKPALFLLVVGARLGHPL